MRIYIIRIIVNDYRENLMRRAAIAALLAVITGSLPAVAADAGQSYTLSIKDHRFDPAELQVPAGTKIKLVVKNLDPTPEEFESKDLKREKIIKGGAEAVITIGPLKPGTYKFFGEYHEATAQGRIVVK